MLRVSRDMPLPPARHGLKRKPALQDLRQDNLSGSLDTHDKFDALFDEAIEAWSFSSSTSNSDNADLADEKHFYRPELPVLSFPYIDGIPPLRPHRHGAPLMRHENVNIIGQIEGIYYQAEPDYISVSTQTTSSESTSSSSTTTANSNDTPSPQPGCCTLLTKLRHSLRTKTKSLLLSAKTTLSHLNCTSEPDLPAHRSIPTSPNFHHWNESELLAIHVASGRPLRIWDFIAWFYTHYDVQCRVNGKCKRMEFPRKEKKYSVEGEVELAVQVAELLETGRVWVEGDWAGDVAGSVRDVLERWVAGAKA